MEIFYWEKAFHTREKRSGKMTFPPQKNFPVIPLSIQGRAAEMGRKISLLV